VSVGPDVMTIKGDGLEDRFSLVEYEAKAGAPGPPPHIHNSNDEAFYILEGEVDFMLEGTTTRLTDGGFVLVPAGERHTFVNAGSGLARWVGIFAPGHYRQLVEELGALLPADGPPDPATLAALFARYDTEIIEA
jgi:mannose-6-phosphate isomerase-like protein (cupin superfamily)